MDKMNKLINIGINLSKEKNYDKLFETILQEMMDMANCDAGTLYVLNNGMLNFKVMVTKSMNVFKGGNDTSKLPPVELKKENICSYCALENKLINIEDVYNTNEFDFSGPKKYDSLTGYKTKSMLVLPMENDKGEVIGVIQLINALNDNKIVSFNKNDEKMFLSLASLAAISLTNMNYSLEVIELLESFARVMSTAIDARTPYNANHTKNMVKYCQKFLEYVSKNKLWDFTDANKRQLLMAIWLHDIGKLVIPLEVMDKATRLGNKLKDILDRFEKIRLIYQIHLLKKEISQEKYDVMISDLENILTLIYAINDKGFIFDDKIKEIEQLQEKFYLDINMVSQRIINADELEMLLIQKGTLSDKERKIIESHVVITARMLSEMTFSTDYKQTPFFASSHHEYKDGSGYPKGLSNKQIPKEVYLITVLDIFEALTARDRPYKAPMSVDKALIILNDMANSGKIDKQILELFIESKCYE